MKILYKLIVKVFNSFTGVLTHYSPVLVFYTPWKHQKIFRFSDIFRGYRKATPGCNGLRTLRRNLRQISHQRNPRQSELTWSEYDKSLYACPYVRQKLVFVQKYFTSSTFPYLYDFNTLYTILFIWYFTFIMFWSKQTTK